MPNSSTIAQRFPADNAPCYTLFMHTDIEKDLHKALENFSKTLPHFEDGRIDYTRASVSPAVLCFVMCKGKLLLAKRGQKVLAYPGKWHGIGGFLDDPQKSLQQKIYEELNEELGIRKEDIAEISTGKVIRVDDPFLHRTWDLYLSVVELKIQTVIRLDWEHTEYRWITPEDIEKYDTVPGLDHAFHEAIESLAKNTKTD